MGGGRRGLVLLASPHQCEFVFEGPLVCGLALGLAALLSELDLSVEMDGRKKTGDSYGQVAVGP